MEVLELCGDMHFPISQRNTVDTRWITATDDVTTTVVLQITVVGEREEAVSPHPPTSSRPIRDAISRAIVFVHP